MVNVTELHQDMKTMSITDACTKHCISFKEAVALLSKYNPYPKKTKFVQIDEPHINKYGNRFIIKKSIKGKLQHFGSYKTLEDAIKVRDYMMEHGWDKSKIKEVKQIVGVEM